LVANKLYIKYRNPNASPVTGSDFILTKTHLRGVQLPIGSPTIVFQQIEITNNIKNPSKYWVFDDVGGLDDTYLNFINPVVTGSC
jgi:hypothetical protein